MKKTLATLSTLALLTQSVGGLMMSTAFAVGTNVENIDIIENTNEEKKIKDLKGGMRSISGGPDSDKFQIVDGTLKFKQGFTPDYENPIDKNVDNVYEIKLKKVGNPNLYDTKSTIGFSRVANDYTQSNHLEDYALDTPNDNGELYYGGTYNKVGFVARGDFAFLDEKEKSVKILKSGYVSEKKVGPNARIYRNGGGAFAALSEGGEIRVRGRGDYGGNQTEAPQGTGRKKIYSATFAFTAIKEDGSIQSWGRADHGGIGFPTDDGYSRVYSTQQAFVALKEDGTLKCWGDPDDCANAPSNVGPNAKIYTTMFAFTAIKEDGSVVGWGKYNNVPLPTDRGYIRVYTTLYCFAGLKSDGSVKGRGQERCKNNIPNNIGQNAKIYPNNEAFVALKKDGSIVVWGGDSYGGNQAEAPQGTERKKIYSNGDAFAAINNNGELKSRGGRAYVGGSNLAKAPSGKNFTKIYSIGRSFVALKEDGTLKCWGDIDDCKNAPNNVGPNAKIYSNGEAFIALEQSGSMTCWGDERRGGKCPTETIYKTYKITITNDPVDDPDIAPPVTPTCTTTPNPAKNGTAITTTCTGVEPGATLTIPNMACQPTPAGDDGIITCTGTVGTEPGQVTTPNDTVTVTDPSGNTNTDATTALVIDNTPPVITLSGSETMTLVDRETYTEPGATCTDNIDTTCTVTIIGSVEEGKIGEYTITYTATDRAGNTSTVTRTVKVVNDTQPHRMGHGQTRCQNGKVEMLMTDENQFSPSAGESKREAMGDDVCSSPVASSDTASTHVATPVTIDVTANDTDTDNVIQTGSVTIQTQPTHGTVAIGSGDVVIYTPDDGYVGEDSFIYTIRDTDRRSALPFGFESEPAEVKVTIDRFRGSATFTGSDTFTPQCTTGRSASDITLTYTETAMNVTGSTLTEAQQNAKKLSEELVKQYIAGSERKTAGQKQADDTCVQTVFTGSATATGSKVFPSQCAANEIGKDILYETEKTITATGSTSEEALENAQKLAQDAVDQDIENNGENFARISSICTPKVIITPPIVALPHTGAEW